METATLENTSKPKLWIALILVLLFPPTAMLYLGRWRYSLLYLVLGLSLMFGLELYGQSANFVLQAKLLYYFCCGVHTFSLHNQYPDDCVRPNYSRWFGISLAILGFISIVAIYRIFIGETFRIKSRSMEPTLSQGTLMFAKKWGYGNYSILGQRLWNGSAFNTPNRGDLLVFEFPNDRNLQFIHRVIGLPGDTIEFTDTQFSINGQLIETRKIDTQEKSEITDAGRDTSLFEQTIDGHHFQIYLDASGQGQAPAMSVLNNDRSCTTNSGKLKCKVPKDSYFVMGDNRIDSFDSRYWGYVPSSHVVGVAMAVN